MKQVLIIFGLSGMLCCNLKVSAQTSASAPILNTNTQPAFDGTKGTFMYALNAREQVVVNYQLTPLHPSDKARFMIHTPDPMPFYAEITNEKEKVVFKWHPVQMVYLYEAEWDLSGLKKGQYLVHIFQGTDKQSAHQFPLTIN